VRNLDRVGVGERGKEVSMRTVIIAVSCLAFLAAGLVFEGVRGNEEKVDTAKQALDKAVADGKKHFESEKTGKLARACATCHANPKKENLHLANRVGDYPKYDRVEKRVITLGQKINQMIDRMLKGKKDLLGSERLVAIEAYLMSLNRAGKSE
jgi:cytochrome c